MVAGATVVVVCAVVVVAGRVVVVGGIVVVVVVVVEVVVVGSAIGSLVNASSGTIAQPALSIFHASMKQVPPPFS